MNAMTLRSGRDLGAKQAEQRKVTDADSGALRKEMVGAGQEQIGKHHPLMHGSSAFEHSAVHKDAKPHMVPILTSSNTCVTNVPLLFHVQKKLTKRLVIDKETLKCLAKVKSTYHSLMLSNKFQGMQNFSRSCAPI